MCSLSMSDTSLSLVFYTFKNAVPQMRNFGQKRLCWSRHALSTASKLFAAFVLSHLQWNTQWFKLYFLVYIRRRNILPHSENTFAENNPIMFLFRGTFYCYLLFPSVQNRLISFSFLPRWCLAILEWFCETKLGKRDRDISETAYKYGNMFCYGLKVVQSRDLGEERRWQWMHCVTKKERERERIMRC